MNHDAMERAIRTDSGGLLEVKASARIRSRAYVQFMHESIRDYFYKSKTRGVFSTSSRLRQAGHDSSQLASFCIGYLSETPISHNKPLTK